MFFLNKFITIFIYSMIATLWFLPVSVLDTYYVATFKVYTLWYILPMMVVSDMINANIAYKFSGKITKILVKKQKHKDKLEEISTKLSGYGFWGLVIFACTPLPYSFLLYGYGAVKWGNYYKLNLAVFIGRTIKYIIIGLLVYLGISVFLY